MANPRALQTGTDAPEWGCHYFWLDCNVCSPHRCCSCCCIHCVLQAAAKRIKVTGSGKFMARRSGKQHMNEKQTRAQKRELSKSFVLEPADVYKAERCLPYAGI